MRKERWVLLFSAVVVAAAVPGGVAVAQEGGGAVEGTEDVESFELRFAGVLGGVTLELPISLAERVESVSSFPVDASGGVFDSDPTFNTELRIGASLNTNLVLAPVRFVVEAEVDAMTGEHHGGVGLEGDFLPGTGEVETQLRKMSLQVDAGPLVHAKGGFMVSHWGMGLLANDGAHKWEPGSASFVDPRGGDRVLRGSLAIGPFFDDGLIIVAGVDKVEDDDALFNEDEARQVVLSVVYGVSGGPIKAGGYVVSRRQKNALDGDTTVVNVLDVTASYTKEGVAGVYKFEGELALIKGETTLGPTLDFPEHEVTQVGAALRASADFGDFGGVVDMLFASGDDNLEDDVQAGFKVDNNYPLGLVLHRFVLGAQTGRGTFTASDPNLTGRPAEDLERFPSQGAVTNTIAFFPRGWWRPIDGLEVYGGPLLAFTAAGLVDPFNTKLGGGTPRNALNGEPGRMLGGEFDLGVRYRRIMAGAELTLGLEAGVLIPGDALLDESGELMGEVYAGRAIVDFKF